MRMAWNHELPDVGSTPEYTPNNPEAFKFTKPPDAVPRVGAPPAVPLICNFTPGDAVPIPTFPPLPIVMRTVSLVPN